MAPTLSIVLSAAILAFATAQSSPKITSDGVNINLRVPRNGDATFSRESVEETSIESIDSGLNNLKLWADNAATENANHFFNLHTGATESIANTSVEIFKSTSFKQFKGIQEIADDLEDGYIANELEISEKALESQFQALLDEKQELVDAMVASYNSTINSLLDGFNSAIGSMQKQITDFNSFKSTEMKKVNTGEWAGGKPIWTDTNYCFSWANGKDHYSSSWTDMPMKGCKVRSKTGWLRVTIDTRTYGQNHGGLRLRSTDNKHILGKQGTYGFQWMNAEHHGHKWQPVTIFRYVQVPKDTTIEFKLQMRSQHNGARLYLHGGNYGQQYAGTWLEIREMGNPTSRS